MSKFIVNQHQKLSCNFLFYCLLPLLFLTSCGNNPKKENNKVADTFDFSVFTKEDFAERLKIIFPHKEKNPAENTIISTKSALALAYQKINYLPIWINEKQEIPEATIFLAELDSVKFDGINLQQYHIEKLQEFKMKATKPSASIDDIIAFDTLCTRIYLQVSKDLLLGTGTAAKADDEWHHENDLSWKAYNKLTSFNESKKYVSLDFYRSKWSVYHSLVEANKHYNSLKNNQEFIELQNTLTASSTDSIINVLIKYEMPWLLASAGDSISETAQLLKGFQYYFGQKPSGKMDSLTQHFLKLSSDSILQKIAVNQERLRWMNQNPEPTNIIVPLGLMEIFLTRDGFEAMHMRAVIGKPGRPTPSLSALMVNVVINPPWGVPPTILKNDVAPGLAKRGGAYLTKKGLKVYNRKGKLVNSSIVNGKNYKNFDYRQDPGAGSALGVIKFNLPNKWDIYLHDTPHKLDFPNRKRAKSSGCVRLQHPRDLGVYILQEMEGDNNMDKKSLDSIILTRKTQFHPLKRKIPVHIVYLTAYSDSTNGHLRLLDDIYKKDAAVANKL